MVPTLDHGDLAIARAADTYQVGDVIVFDVIEGEDVGLVIHRIIRGDGESGYETQGDGQGFVDPFTTTDEDVKGRVLFAIPNGALFLNLLRSPFVWAIMAGVFVAMFLWPSKKDEETDEQSEELSDGDPEDGSPGDTADEDDRGEALSIEAMLRPTTETP